MPTPGVRIGGRQKGTPNRSTLARRMLVAKAMEALPSSLEDEFSAPMTGITPMAIADAVLNRCALPNGLLPSPAQIDMAKAAFGYYHPKLSATLVKDVRPTDLPLDEQVARFREHLANPSLRYITDRLIDADDEDDI